MHLTIVSILQPHFVQIPLNVEATNDFDIFEPLLGKDVSISLTSNRARTWPNFCDQLVAGGSELMIELDDSYFQKYLTETGLNYTSRTYLLTSDKFFITVSHDPCHLIIKSANFD